MASSSNPIAESATISSNYYHVFLNHRGSDVKETLATHLHKRLSDKGLRVFLDKDELQEGDDIPSHLKGAIGSACVHIAIFSPNYAESSWCLNELLLMLESRKTIIPIFYGVKPDVLRWTRGTKGVYAKHLSILEWKEADDSEPRLRKPRYDTNTMREWRNALKRASYLKGFAVKAEAYNSDDSQLVDNVVERVLEKLSKTPLNVSKYPTGLADKVEDLERTVLMPQESGETRIVGIVGLGGVGKTTLTKEIFNRERSKCHRSCFLPDVREKTANRSFNSVVSTLSMSRLELLRTPGDCLKDILRRVQSPEYLIWLHCHDFPFASLPRWIPMERLSVLYVQGDKLGWLWGDRNSQAPLQLRQLEITARLLKIPKSIGQLKYLEKIVVRPLEGLINRTSSGATVVIHKVPLETLPDEFCDLQCLEHLELAYCSEMKSLPESFGNLKNLQHLDLSGCSKLRTLPNSFGNLKQLKHLILICCTGLTISSETLGNITTLELIDMRYSTKIEVLPPQVAHQRYLSELCLTGTNIRELPSAIGDLRDLKILDIGGPSLEMLPPWLGCLRSLKELAIGSVNRYHRKLPDWLCAMNWKELGIGRNLDSFSSNQLKCLPDSIGELNQLEKLSLKYTGVECLPPCIMALNNLQRLEVLYSPLRELPFKRDSLVECMLGLTDLWLESTRISEIAFGKGICPNLQSLCIHCCERLAEVGTLPNTLTELEFCYCKTLKNIEGLSGLENLCYLEIRGCPKVEEFSGFGTLKSLESLWIDECGEITGIRGLQQLTKLRDLIVSDCCVLEELAGIEHLIGLRLLHVSKCPNMHCGEEVLKHLCQREEEGLLNLRYNPLGA